MAETTPRPPLPGLGIGVAGPVILIGGAEDKRRDRIILTRFVEVAGGEDAHVVIISTASTLGDLATERYGELFEELGVKRVTGLRPLTREEANDPTVAGTLADATGIFLTGGNQVRLVSVVGGTRLEDALASAHDRGAVVAGTSAGASAVSTHMVAFGRPGASPKHRMIHIAAGLGLVDIVDEKVEDGEGGREVIVLRIRHDLATSGEVERQVAIGLGDLRRSCARRDSNPQPSDP